LRRVSWVLGATGDDAGRPPLGLVYLSFGAGSRAAKT